VFACITGVIGLSLVVAALSNTTDFSQKEDLVYGAIESERMVQDELKREAGAVVKDFLVWVRLRKRQIEGKRRIRLVMGLITHTQRFKTKRL